MAVRYAEAQQTGTKSMLTAMIREWQSDPRCRVRVSQTDHAAESVETMEGTVAMTAAELRQKFGTPEERMTQ